MSFKQCVYRLFPIILYIHFCKISSYQVHYRFCILFLNAQENAIKKLEQTYGIFELPEPLMEAAMLRIANPDVSLADLALLGRRDAGDARGQNLAVGGYDDQIGIDG